LKLHTTDRLRVPYFPWQTINKVNTEALLPGDSVLFKRGETWRGQLIPQSGSNVSEIFYGAYSSGDKPMILGSINKSNTSDWVDQGANIWESTQVFFTDVGNIIFDNELSVGFKKWNLVDLLIQDDYWYDLVSGRVSVFSTSNPALSHTVIELALREHIVNQENKSDITFDNLSIKYGAAHGFGGGNTANIAITSCDISYIGGGDLNMDGLIRFGNGVEFWGNASNNSVEKCRIWEIYDTGVTNQNHTNTAVQENIRYRNNLIWNCGLASFEYWNRPVTSTTSNIYFENNTCLFAGSGWGVQRPDYHGIHAVIDANPAQTDTIFIRNNIFYNAQRSIYAVEDNINGFIDLDYNLINQNLATDTLFASFPSFTLFTFASFTAYTSATGKDVNSITGVPEFVDLSGLNFQLTNLSPCIDAGTAVNLTDDFNADLRPFYGGFDIGAYEYSGPLSVAENSIEKVRIFPNPAKESIFISEIESFGSNASLLIVDAQGKIIREASHFKFSEKIDTSQLTEGIYLLVIESETGEKAIGKMQILR